MTAVVTAPARSLRGTDYADLGRQVRAAGLLGRRRGACTAYVGAVLVLFVAGGALIAVLGDTWWQLLTHALGAPPRPRDDLS